MMINLYPHLQQLCSTLNNLQHNQLESKIPNHYSLIAHKKQWIKLAIIALHCQSLWPAHPTSYLNLRGIPILQSLPQSSSRLTNADLIRQLESKIQHHLHALAHFRNTTIAITDINPTYVRNEIQKSSIDLATALTQALHLTNTYLNQLTSLSECTKTKLLYYQKVTNVACAKLKTLANHEPPPLQHKVATALLEKKSRLQTRSIDVCSKLDAYRLDPSFLKLVDQLVKTRSLIKSVQAEIELLSGH